ncbi:sensor histidine kinase [Paenibacillus ihumii]|uniref:sensor histidine kinase n=1 Tax=Paenibacillus ihumii TaxID=687436 RepID=UPI0006D7EF1A|nr:sensor histidine kinase [Paenibacillus ihumii]
MIRKLYPPDQIEHYLTIDVIVLVTLAYLTIVIDRPLGWGAAILLYILMLVCFYVALWQRGWLLVLAAWAGLGIITVYSIYYSSWMILYGFVYADLLGRARSDRIMWAGMAGIAAMFLVSYTVLYGEILTFVMSPMMPFLILQLIMPYIIRTVEHSRRLSSKLHAANRKLERYIQEEERNRIARDLHDTLGQTLTMIKMKSELASRLMDKDTSRARSEIDEIKISARQALQQVRELVTSIRHVTLQDELRHALQLLSSAGITVDHERFQGTPSLGSSAETMLALSLREAVTNIVRHSGADCCSIHDDVGEDSYSITIQDNGRGLQPEQTEGFGLPSMQERMRQVQGHALIAPAPSGGTIVKLRVPLSVAPYSKRES